MKIIALLIILFSISLFNSFGQEAPLTPINNSSNVDHLKSGTSKMTWYIMQDSIKISIGNIETKIKKETDRIFIITTVDMKQSPSKWIDSTIVESLNFKPIYHSSYNQQREMV